MEMNFCRRCGKPLTHTKRHIYICANGHTLYANHSPAVGVFFVSPDNKEVLLTTRGIEPNKGKISALGGFLDGSESLESAALREIREEAGLQPQEYTALTYLTSEYDTYAYQGEMIPVITTFFWTRLKSSQKPEPNENEIAAIDSYVIANIDLEQIGAQDVRAGIHKLRELFLQGNANSNSHQEEK